MTNRFIVVSLLAFLSSINLSSAQDAINISKPTCADIKFVDGKSSKGPLLGTYLLQEYKNRNGLLKLKKYIYAPSGEPMLHIGNWVNPQFSKLLDIAGNVVEASSSQMTGYEDIFNELSADCRSTEVAVIIDRGNGVPLKNSDDKLTSANAMLFRLKTETEQYSYYVFDRSTRQLIKVAGDDLVVEASNVDEYPSIQSSSIPDYWMVWLPVIDDRYFIPSENLCRKQFVCRPEEKEEAWYTKIIQEWIVDEPKKISEKARKELIYGQIYKLCHIEKSIAFTASFGISADVKILSFESSAETEYKYKYDKGIVMLAKQKSLSRNEAGYPTYEKSLTIRKRLSCVNGIVKNLDWVAIDYPEGDGNTNIDLSEYAGDKKPVYFTDEVYSASKYPESFIEQKFKVVSKTLNGMANFGPILMDIAKYSKFSFGDELVDWYLVSKVMLTEIAGPEK